MAVPVEADTGKGEIYAKWVSRGGSSGSIGFPVSDEKATPDGEGRFNRFQNGLIYWSTTSGAHWVSDAISFEWGETGYEAGPYGYPMTDSVEVPGESGSFEQEFQFGSIYVRDDGYMSAGRVEFDLEFHSYDVALHPQYPEVDLSEYDVDSANALQKAKNNAEAQNVQSVMYTRGWSNARDLFEHFYTNSGLDFRLNSDALDGWVTSGETSYKDTKTPLETISANRDEAVRKAISRADSLSKPYKSIIKSPWVDTGSTGGGDYQNSLGQYSLSSTTAAIAYPGEPGKHRIELRQQVHVYDKYDFKEMGEPGPASYGNDVAYRGQRIGIAKPFLSLGSGGISSWSGLR